MLIARGLDRTALQCRHGSEDARVDNVAVVVDALNIEIQRPRQLLQWWVRGKRKRGRGEDEG